MANLFQKLSRNKSNLRIFTCHKIPLNFPKFIPPLINTNNPILFSDPSTTDSAVSTQKLQFFPSFPFGYCLNPISSCGFDQLKVIEAEKEVETDDARTIWADSVKKKRKKKMNKHKYKKLRKRLRRKT
ncbi:hypothetical protein Patl1_18192 [Pistacia atlantica]|uniref:Uncharacterized protein n=1 Tax=Pistacia atlantica TaxID=434234 RepID=A0ACC1BXT3_9ROSI|nr:hypothetical protein Patl1_18192 [Pistacia atlantica]